LGTRQEAVVPGFEDGWQIPVDISSETLKNAKLLKNRTRKNEDFFVCNTHKLSNLPFQHTPRSGSFLVAHVDAFVEGLLPAEQFTELIGFFHAPKNTGAGSKE
jgi:hypothetical protein